MFNIFFSFFITVLISVMLTVSAIAQDDGNPANWCRNGLFPSEKVEFRLAKITGAKDAKVYFYNDFSDDCPSDTAECRQKSYLVPGDEVMISRKYGSYVCSWFEPRRGSETVGWIHENNLIISEPDKNPSLAEWIGNWENGDNWLGIQPDKATGFLAVEGDAFWHGLNENVHVGAISTTGKPERNVLSLNDEVCEVSLKLVGDLLIVSDNAECGGVNVRFNGVYRKSRDARLRRSKVINEN